MDPNYIRSYQNRGTVKAVLKNYEGAIEDFSKVIELDSNYAVAYQNRGYAKKGMNDLVGAQKDFDRAIELEKAKNINANRSSI